MLTELYHEHMSLVESISEMLYAKHLKVIS